MNLSPVEYILGRLMMVCAGSMLLPAALSFILLEADVLTLLASAAITMTVGYSLTLHGSDDTSMTNREAILTVTLSWVCLSFFGALPYIFSGVLPPLYAVLESASGFSTVGSSLITDLDKIPRSVLLWRNMTQWLGGMGIIVLFISFLPHYGTGAINMFNAELPGPSKDRVMPRLGDTASLLWKIYTGLTVCFIILMFFIGLSPFDAITHGMATISTGGFTCYNDGVLHFNNPLAEVLTAVFTIIAAGNFYLYYHVYNRGIERLFSDLEFKTFIAFVAGFTLLITLNLILQAQYTPGYALHNAFFHVASVLSTSGLAITDLSAWPPFSKFLLFSLLFVGGCAASTAGGIKIARVIVLLKICWVSLKHNLHPKMIANWRISGKSVDSASVTAITRHFFVFMAIYFFSTAFLTLCGANMPEAMLIMASTIGTAGTDIAFSLLGNPYVYADISDPGKILITVCMILGRLEFFTLLVLLRPEFWRKTRSW